MIETVIAAGIAMLSALVALVAAGAVLVNWLVDGRFPWRSAGVTAASAIIFLVACGAVPPAYSQAEHDRISRLHAQFAPALERYRQTHGTYPPNLEAVGIPTPETEYGPLRYNAWPSCQKGPPCYEISFGDYGENGFTAYFNSRHGDWSLDQ